MQATLRERAPVQFNPRNAGSEYLLSGIARCGYCGKALIGQLGGYPFDWHRRMLEEFQTVKPYLWGDFYPLTSCGTATDGVLAYQLGRPELASGVIFAFRRQDCETASFHVTPELEKGVQYIFEDIEGGTPASVTGGEAFEIAITEKRGSRLILYHKDGRQ